MSSARGAKRLCVLALAAGFGLGTARGADRFVSTAGSDANDGSGWGSAWATLSNAVNNAAPGDAIYVASGAYGVTAEVLVNKAVSIIGTGSPADTIVQRTGIQSNRIFNISSPGALVANLTIRNGYITADNGGSGGGGTINGGAGVFMTGGIVSNCVIVANTNNSLQGAGYAYGGGVTMGGGTLWGCTVSSNGAMGYGSYGQGVYMSNGIVRDCLVIGNTGRLTSDQRKGAGIAMFNGNPLVTNTVVIGNGGTAQVGGIYCAAGNVTDSTIISNVTQGIQVANGRSVRNCRIGYNTSASGWTYANLDLEGGIASNCIIFEGTTVPGILLGSGSNLVMDCVISNFTVGTTFGAGVKTNRLVRSTVFNSAINLGNAAAANENQGWVSGPSESWNLGYKNLTIGFATATGNVMAIVNTGSVVNAGLVSILGVNNSLVVSNGSTLTASNGIVLGAAGSVGNWLDAESASLSSFGLTVGSASSNNTVAVRNGTTWDLKNGPLAWGAGLATNNSLVVDETSALINAGSLSLNDAGRTLVLSNGALDGMDVQFSGGALNIGTGPNLAPVTLVIDDYSLNPAGTTNGGASVIGNASHTNTVALLSGAQWNVGGQALSIGSGVARGNALRIDGQGVEGSARASNVGALIVGVSAPANGLMITNGGQLFGSSAGATLGSNLSNNTAVVVGGGPAGAPSLWNLGGGSLLVGGASSPNASYNQVIADGAGVSGGAVITNLVDLRIGNGAGMTGNRATLRNGGHLVGSTAVVSYNIGTNQGIEVIGGAGASRLALSGQLALQAYYSSLLVDGLGVDGSARVSAGGLLKAEGSSTLMVTNQGRLSASALQLGGGSYNQATVTDPGSTATLFGQSSIASALNQTGNVLRVVNGGTLTSSAGFNIGVYPTNILNRVVVSGQGKLYTGGAVSLGTGFGSTGNYALVEGAGSLWSLGNQALTIGGTNPSTRDNYLKIEEGGTLDNVGTLVTYTNNGLVLSGGTLGMWNTTLTNGLFAAGDGLQAALLKGLGGTLTFAGGLLISSNAVLGGYGVAGGGAAGIALAPGGDLNPGVDGAGLLTIGGSNLAWSPGAAYICEVTNLNFGAGAGWDLLALQAPQLTPGGPGLVVRMDSMGSPAANFDPARDYSLKIIQDGSTSGVPLSLFVVDTNAFPGGLEPWTLTNLNGAVYLQYRGSGLAYAPSSRWNDPNSGLWSVPGNWTPDGLPVNDGTAVLEFGGGAPAYASTNDLGTFLLNQLLLTGTGGTFITNTLGGSRLVFTNANARLDVTDAGFYLITNGITMADPVVFGGLGAGSLILAGVGGGQPFVKEGPWTLALRGSNTFAEPVVVDNPGGVVRLEANAAFGTNSFIVSNGTLQTTAALTLGNGGLVRRAVVSGGGALWTNAAALTVGSNATVTVEEGGRLVAVGGLSFEKMAGADPAGFLIRSGGKFYYTNAFTVGQSSSGNKMTITGSGSVLMGPGDDAAQGTSWIRFGGAGYSDNALLIEDGGTFTNTRLQAVGSSSVTVTNGGRLFATSASIGGNSTMSFLGGVFPAALGTFGSINMNGVGALVLVDGKDVDNSAVVNGGINVGQSSGNHNNRLRVTNKGRFTAIGSGGTLSIGAGGTTNNGVEIVQQGYGKFAAGSGYYGIGFGNFANKNFMLVEDEGSVLEIASIGYRWEIGFGNNATSSNSGNRILVRNFGVMTNAALLSIASFSANGTNAFNNGILVSATGRVYSSAACEVGMIGGVTGNFLKVTDEGSYWNMGYKTVTIGNTNGLSTNNYLMITAGGVMENVSNLVVHPNNQAFLYGGTLGLHNAILSNNVPFVAGDGDQAAVLKAQSGTLFFPAGLVVTNNALLTGVGGVRATTTVHGALSPGLAAAGLLVNNGDFILKPGAATTVELAAYTAPGTGWDQLAVTNGSLLVDGTLTVLLTGGFTPTNTQSFIIMTNRGPLSVSGSFANTPGGLIPAYTTLGGKAAGNFQVLIGSKGVTLGAFEPLKANPGTVIVIR